MAFTPNVTTVNQVTQIGAESTSALGTPVAASKKLLCFTYDFGIKGDVSTYRATGHKYSSEQEENEEWVEGTLSGSGDFNGLIYPAAGAFGDVAPANHGASSTAKDWIYVPPVTGTIAPRTYSFEQGDAVRARKFAYGLHTAFGYKFDRKTFTVNGKVLGQQISDGITMTASPTSIALAPIGGKGVDVYLDSTSGGIGTTKLLKFFSGEFLFDSAYTPVWTVNSANASFDSHADLAPKTTFKMLVAADSQGMGLLANLQAGSTVYIRVDAKGNTIDAPNSIKNELIHDMACKVLIPDQYSDSNGVYAIGWNFEVVEDPAWGASGQAHKMTITNLLTAL